MKSKKKQPAHILETIKIHKIQMKIHTRQKPHTCKCFQFTSGEWLFNCDQCCKNFFWQIPCRRPWTFI